MKGKFKLFQGDCLELMKQIPEGSVDLVLCDLPYGVTSCPWDKPLSPGILMGSYSRLLTQTGTAVLFGNIMLLADLCNGSPKNLKFKGELVWDKQQVSGFALAKNTHLRSHELLGVFSKGFVKHPGASGRMTYNPQNLVPLQKEVNGARVGKGEQRLNCPSQKTYVQEFTNYPRSLLRFGRQGRVLHPTQKPVALMEYLIKTYTNPGDTVLDNCMGSGTTGVAAVRHGRFFIGMELEDRYFKIAQGRIQREFDGEDA